MKPTFGLLNAEPLKLGDPHLTPETIYIRSLTDLNPHFFLGRPRNIFSHTNRFADRCRE